VIRVKDTGLGIPLNKLETIFEMFAQVHRNLPHSQSGLGIGLALAKRLVVLYGGSLAAESEFIVRLPLASEGRGREPSPAVEDAIGSSRRILIVDDNTDAAASLAMLLQLANHETYTGA
jgi:histidine kinase/DNA gyrase B/HSP90-like ATPase